jgi:hypothetical protein
LTVIDFSMIYVGFTRAHGTYCSRSVRAFPKERPAMEQDHCSPAGK